LRLSAGDGDYAGTGQSSDQTSFGRQSHPADPTIDWGVGELRSSGQGVAYTTLASGTAVADTVACPGNPVPQTDVNHPTAWVPVATACEAGDTDKTQSDLRSARLIELPVYALNSFQFVPGTGE